MKIVFKHKKQIAHSKVIEALCLVRALHDRDLHGELVDLSGFEAVIDQHKAQFAFLERYPQFHLAIVEMALAVQERQDPKVFFDQVAALPIEKQVYYYMGCEMELEEIDLALKEPERFEPFIQSEDKAEAVHALLNITDHLNGYKQVVTDLMNTPAFLRDLNQQADKIADMIFEMEEAMSYRHPLSYAQEVMGKSFWNIADWSVYEFVPVYYLSPVLVRFMDSDRQIFLRPLYRRVPDEEQVKAEIASRLKLLSDPKRLEILRMTYMRPMYGKQIADELGLTTATVSHHLDALYKSGLLHMERDRQVKYFSTNNRGLQALMQQVTEHIRR